MTEELQVLADLTSRLEHAGIQYMLTGSMALACYGHPRMTQDLDLVVAFTLRDVDRLVELLQPDYYVSSDAARQAVLHQSIFNVISQRVMIKLDLIVRKREEYRLLEFERRVRTNLDGIDIWVVSKEDLIISKLAWAQPSASQRQLSDVLNLIATGCDMDYVRLWSARLNLTDMLTRVIP